MNHFDYFVTGVLGGLSLELVQFQTYKSRLSLNKYRRLFRDPTFWICLCLLVLSSGLIAWGMNVGQDNKALSQVFVTGVAARSIIRDLLAAKSAGKATALGGNADDEIGLKDIFG